MFVVFSGVDFSGRVYIFTHNSYFNTFPNSSNDVRGVVYFIIILALIKANFKLKLNQLKSRPLVYLRHWLSAQKVSIIKN